MIRVGIGGWTFAPWRGSFYPEKLVHSEELAYASRQLTAIEINATFHGTQRRESFAKWRDATPEGFIFTVKAPRAATYRRDLAGAGPSVERFLGSGVLELADRLGPILWQLAPQIAFEPASLEAFLALLPRRRDGVVLQHAIEAVHPSYDSPVCAALLGAADIARVFIDDEGVAPAPEPSGGLAYARLKRSALRHPAGYEPQALRRWAERFRGWDAACPNGCFVFFIGGDKVRAPAAAGALLRLLAEPSSGRRAARRGR